MTTDIMPFDFHGQTVRTLTDSHGEPWFVAKDVCDILGLSNVSVALSGLDEDETSKIDPKQYLGSENRSNQPINIVSEPGLYVLIGKSRKPEAKAFRRWVNHEVLPSIRKTGSYTAILDPATAAYAERCNRICLLQLAKGIVHPDYLEAKARIVIADQFGELPEIDPGRRPLTVADYLKEKGLTATELKSVQSVFGKKLKHAYRDKHGHDPMKTDIEVKGRIRPVYAYTEADRLLFDTVYISMQEHRLAA